MKGSVAAIFLASSLLVSARYIDYGYGQRDADFFGLYDEDSDMSTYSQPLPLQQDEDEEMDFYGRLLSQETGQDELNDRFRRMRSPLGAEEDMSPRQPHRSQPVLRRPNGGRSFVPQGKPGQDRAPSSREAGERPHVHPSIGGSQPSLEDIPEECPMHDHFKGLDEAEFEEVIRNGEVSDEIKKKIDEMRRNRAPISTGEDIPDPSAGSSDLPPLEKAPMPTIPNETAPAAAPAPPADKAEEKQPEKPNSSVSALTTSAFLAAVVALFSV